MATLQLDWLESQLEKANRNMETARQQHEKSLRLLQEAERAVDAYAKVLKDAKLAQGQGAAPGSSAALTMNMPDHIEAILEKHSLLSATEIFEILKQEGREKTTKNSVLTQLNRLKSTRFMKNDDGQWYNIPNIFGDDSGNQGVTP